MVRFRSDQPYIDAREAASKRSKAAQLQAGLSQQIAEKNRRLVRVRLQQRRLHCFTLTLISTYENFHLYRVPQDAQCLIDESAGELILDSDHPYVYVLRIYSVQEEKVQ